MKYNQFKQRVENDLGFTVLDFDDGTRFKKISVVDDFDNQLVEIDKYHSYHIEFFSKPLTRFYNGFDDRERIKLLMLLSVELTTTPVPER